MDGWMDGCTLICMYLSMYVSIWLTLLGALQLSRSERPYLTNPRERTLLCRVEYI